MQRKTSPEEHVALLEKIKGQVACFNNMTDMQRYDELLRLKDYMDYRIEFREYEAKVAAAHGNVAALRKQYVDAVLAEFDDAEKSRAEEANWGWSPLYRLLKEWPLPNFRKSPWAHTIDEWAEIEACLLEKVSSEPLSLELECPHILRAFLLLVRTFHGYSRPLPHPNLGLTFQYILDFALDNEKSVALTNVVQTLATTGWAMFPGIHLASDTFSNLHTNTVSLLGYDPEKQVGVVERIRSFLGRIAHRAVADMIRRQQSSLLHDMWCESSVSEHQRVKCEEVRIYNLHMAKLHSMAVRYLR